MKTPKGTRRSRHFFRFKLQGDEDGVSKVITAPALVRTPKKRVRLTFKADHVLASQKAGGVGNTQTCAMAFCAKAQKEAFPHPVEGYVDWWYDRAYVVSKVNRVSGLPTECYVYRHHDKVAPLNDTKGGQRKLLAMLERDGDKIITLYPPKAAKPRPGRARGRNTGERSQPRLVGSKLRFAVASLGGVA